MIYLKKRDNMKVNNIQNNSFHAVYKMPCSEKIMQEFNQKVAPAYQEIKHDTLFYFRGSNPYKLAIINLIDNIAEKTYGMNWLKMNAQNHGVDINDIDKVDYMHVFSGVPDIANLLVYIEGRQNPKKSLVSKMKSIFQNDEKEYALPKDLPEHLRDVYYYKKINKEEDEAFEDFYKPVIREVQNPQELLKALLTEK